MPRSLTKLAGRTGINCTCPERHGNGSRHASVNKRRSLGSDVGKWGSAASPRMRLAGRVNNDSHWINDLRTALLFRDASNGLNGHRPSSLVVVLAVCFEHRTSWQLRRMTFSTDHLLSKFRSFFLSWLNFHHSWPVSSPNFLQATILTASTICFHQTFHLPNWCSLRQTACSRNLCKLHYHCSRCSNWNASLVLKPNEIALTNYERHLSIYFIQYHFRTNLFRYFADACGVKLNKGKLNWPAGWLTFH